MKLVNDIIFKAVFAREENKDILRCLINALLDLRGDERITELTLLNPFIEREFHDDKLVVLDIKAKVATGKVYNIEVQINPDKSYINRAVLYLSKLYGEQVEIGGRYIDIPKTIGISIIDEGLLFKDNPDIHNVFRYRNIKTNKDLTDKIEINFIELDKFIVDKPVELRTRFEKWLHLLRFGETYKENDVMLPEELKSEEGITEAFEAYQKALSNEYVREIIRMREKAIIDRKFALTDARDAGREEGERIGIEKGERIGIEKGERIGIEKGERIGIEKGERIGIEKGVFNVARNMKKMGMDITLIARSTGLTESEIEKL